MQAWPPLKLPIPGHGKFRGENTLLVTGLHFAAYFRGNETSKMTVTERQNDELENEIHKICVIMTRHYRLQ